MMWCGKCYTSTNNLKFHIHRARVEEDDAEQERMNARWKKKHKATEFLEARDGDHLIIPFECDLCVFVKLKGRYPTKSSKEDRKLAACIRRINLDAFSSR